MDLLVPLFVYCVFAECKNKGLMMVSRLLTYDIMRKFTHGVITKMTQSGRIADTWSGATGHPPPYFKPSNLHTLLFSIIL